MRSWKDKQREQVKASIADAMAAQPTSPPMTANNEQGESFEEYADNRYDVFWAEGERVEAEAAWDNRTEHYQKLLAEKEAEIERLETVIADQDFEYFKLMRDRIKELEAQLQQFHDLIGESVGVAGYHLNGDIAYWTELDMPSTGGE